MAEIEKNPAWRGYPDWAEIPRGGLPRRVSEFMSSIRRVGTYLRAVSPHDGDCDLATHFPHMLAPDSVRRTALNRFPRTVCMLYIKFPVVAK